MEEITLKSEMTKETFLRTFHLYKEDDIYILRSKLLKKKTHKSFILTHEFTIELINIKINLPSPFNESYYDNYCWMPELNFNFQIDSLNYRFKISKEIAERFLEQESEYELDEDDAEENVKNFIRNIRLKSILD